MIDYRTRTLPERENQGGPGAKTFYTTAAAAETAHHLPDGVRGARAPLPGIACLRRYPSRRHTAVCRGRDGAKNRISTENARVGHSLVEVGCLRLHTFVFSPCS